MCFWCIWPYGFTVACIVINGNLIITSSIINKNTARPGQRVKLSGPAVSISSILLRHHTVPTINKQTHWELMCQTSLSARLLSSSVNRGLLYMIKILCFTNWNAYKYSDRNPSQTRRFPSPPFFYLSKGNQIYRISYSRNTLKINTPSSGF